jgi:hypothetical protein
MAKRQEIIDTIDAFLENRIKENDRGSYKGYIRNASTTLVAVAVSHNGSGTLDLYLSV